MKTQTLTIILLCFVASVAAQNQETSCTTCHGDSDFFTEDRVAIVTGTRQGIHQSVGLSCHDCHGGNPDPSLAEDMVAAMDESYGPNPYIGVPEKSRIPALCGECHSNPEFMRQFRPDIRVDQEQEYWTSQHGRSLRQGDSKVAACVDCHGVHGIKAASDPASPVYPTQVAGTCASCHADSEYMADYTLEDGSPLPTDQYAGWQVSVHGRSMTEREDLSAPTCNDCHGNHGATPPGVQSISFICGQCHGREAELFRNSPKLVGFETHNELLSEMPGADCSMCHDIPPSFEEIAPVRSLGECETCHGNHAIIRPNITMLAPLPETPCEFCHETTAVEEPSETYLSFKNALLEEAAEQGWEGEELFNEFYDRALQLPTHTVEGSDGQAPQLRPEFSRLVDKFRLGKTHFQIPASGSEEASQRAVVRCSNCHFVDGDSPSDSSQVGSTFLTRMRELTAVTAEAERTLLRARRGGVETREALIEVDEAVDAAIELQVLVHTFSTEEGGDFMTRYEEGMTHANGALELAQEAVEELNIRRRGLYISLVFICLFLVALGLKIRNMERNDESLKHEGAEMDPSR